MSIYKGRSSAPFFLFYFPRSFYSSLVISVLLCAPWQASNPFRWIATKHYQTCVYVQESITKKLGPLFQTHSSLHTPTPSSKGERGQKPNQKKWATPRRP